MVQDPLDNLRVAKLGRYVQRPVAIVVNRVDDLRFKSSLFGSFQ